MNAAPAGRYGGRVPANRGRCWNIGSDGQIYLGAIFATGIGLLLVPLNWPLYVLSPVVLLAAVVGGGI